MFYHYLSTPFPLKASISPVATAFLGPSVPLIFPLPATTPYCDSEFVTNCGTSKSSEDPPTKTTNSISLIFPVLDTCFKALKQLTTKTLSLAVFLIVLIFSIEVVTSIGINSPSFTITTFANILGSKAFSKNCTLPSSCLM